MKKTKQKWLWFSICMGIFISLIILVKTNQIAKFDNSIYQITQFFKCSFMTSFFKIISYLACVSFLTIITLVITIYNFKKNKDLTLLFNLLGIAVMIIGLKALFSRPRPLDIMLIDETGYSFPSGHSMGSLGFYGYFIYLVYKSKLTKDKKEVLISFLSLLILLIGFSRIYLGVHFASDVLAGYTLSICYLIIFITFIKPKIEKII